MSGRGKRLEAIVRKAAKSLADRQIARIYRWAEASATRLVPVRCRCGAVYSTTQVLHTEAPGADFWGFTVAGRIVMIECKEAEGLRLPIGRSGLKVHQMQALGEVNRAGGVALVLWYRGNEIAVLDVDLIGRLTKNGDRLSIPWREIPKSFIHSDEDFDGLFTPYLQSSPG